MIKVRIKDKQDVVTNKTYYDKMDLCWDLRFILDFPLHKNYREDLSNKICDLNFGKTYKIVLISYAFLPFKDKVNIAAKYNVKYILQPHGSIRDNEVIEAANKHNIIMVMSNMRIFTH